MLIPFQKTVFIKSVVHLSQLPPDHGCEVAFAGRSNAGKSTALNVITGIANLAKTSKTPGRTQAINIFQVENHCRLVDLPGYGYAKVPLSVKQQWQKTLSIYLQTRESLKGLCLIMDIRHPLTALDDHMLQWAEAANLTTHILLSKADKLSKGAAAQTLQKIKKRLGDNPILSCQLFSAQQGETIIAARKNLSRLVVAGI